MYDYPNPKDCFPSANISGGVCYFLWDKAFKGECSFVNIINGQQIKSQRKLDEYDVFVRYNKALTIIHKVVNSPNFKSLMEIVSTRNPFNLDSSFRGKQNKNNPDDILVYSSGGRGWAANTVVTSSRQLIDVHKVFMGKVLSGHIGETDDKGQVKVIASIQAAQPKEVCTDSYLLIGNFNNSVETNNLKEYLKTKTLRYLLLQALASMNISRANFRFIPLLDFSKTWTDEMLYKKYALTAEEIDTIERMIKPMV